MKAFVKKLKAYKAEVTVEEIKKKYGLSKLVRLSSNESVYGPSPKAIEAIKGIDLSQLNYYPDGQAGPLRRAVAQQEGVAEDSLVFGDGGDEIIELLTRTILTPGSEMIVPDPTFGEYVIHAEIEGAKTVAVPIKAATGQIDFAGMLKRVNNQTALIFLANPNNPTGVQEKVADIEAFLKDLPNNVILVVDEAYYEFSGNAQASCVSLVAKYPNLVVLRTVSKAYGLANLRVGYAILPEKLAGILQAVRLPYNLSNFQITGAAAAIQDQDFLAQVVSKVAKEREIFQAFLKEVSIKFYPSTANFIWFEMKDSARLAERLLQSGYQVKSSLDPNHIRLTLGKPEDNQAIRTIIKDYVQSAPAE
ncbi:histidinol-phosphate transaminase [Eupransor demetentiae]|uniref:Histidinol-phosphate aminotransferase n=1 Tax=Eupransor demetentiae TaxID=3109584 RepID=A0ABM9N383_9LACO|nr:Histidinol-phosphate/aromatic aminotransferase or cobyric acid decarboxylase (HisC) [Lactobacillaceae bacterium LMG 33000]